MSGAGISTDDILGSILIVRGQRVYNAPKLAL
jgi:hypothetical protein